MMWIITPPDSGFEDAAAGTYRHQVHATSKAALTVLTRFIIGADASCTDGACGQLSRVVIDPAILTVTHLVVEPADRQQLGRLVPLDLVDPAPGQIRLRCATAEFYELACAEKAQFVRGTGDYARYGQGQPARPYYAQARSRPGAGVEGRLPQTSTYDILPPGLVAVRGGDPVHAIDGDAGHVTGIVRTRAATTWPTCSCKRDTCSAART